MTQLVVDAERRGELPPTRITPHHLQQCQQPTLSELRAAFSLHRLSCDIATCLYDQDLIYPSDMPISEYGFGIAPPEDPARMPEWTARVSQTVFRLLIVGAALAGAYKEPLFKALEHPDPDIQALARRVPQYYFKNQGWDRLQEKEMAFLLQFPVCDLDATLEAQDVVFGPIAQWLLDSILSDKESRQAMADRFEQGYGRAGIYHSHPTHPDDTHPAYPADEKHCIVRFMADGRGSHSDAYLVVWELMKMFWLVEQVRPYPLDQRVLDRHPPRTPSTQGVGADENNGGLLESAVAVFFGMFGAEETLLLTTPADGPWRRLITRPAVPETKRKEAHGDGTLPRSMSVAVFFNYIFNHSGRPNHIDWTDEPVASLEFKFFEYVLQRHLGLCLDCQSFYEDVPQYGLFREFISTITIFSHDDVEARHPLRFWEGGMEVADFLDGTEMLTQYPPYFRRYYAESNL
jgi:hypothetical protein